MISVFLLASICSIAIGFVPVDGMPTAFLAHNDPSIARTRAAKRTSVSFSPNSFVKHSTSSSTTLQMNSSSRKVETLPDIATKDKEGNDAQPVGVKSIERDWTYVDETTGETYVADGNFKVNIIVPENGDNKVKGFCFFLHGFSQYPVAYRQTLQTIATQAQVAVLAVETGITSGIVLKGIFEKPLSFITNPSWPQFVLQRAVLEDTKQCIRMVLEKDPTFYKLVANDVSNDLPLGVCGHSMGGGLSFVVPADFPQIQHVFSMAPAAGVEQFDPIKKGIDVRTADNCMALSGTWDIIVRPKAVTEIADAASNQKPRSSILVSITRGVHTGFEDQIVLFQIPIRLLAIIIIPIFNILPFLEVLFITPILRFLRTNTGQLEGSSILASYFFQQMVNKRDINPDDASEYLNENDTEGDTKGKFAIQYADGSNDQN